MAKTERRTIKIASVSDWRQAGKAKVLEFTGEDRVKYETWSENFAEFIKLGATIEADVEFSENTKDGTTYFHNKVVQLYIDGQPVKSKRNFQEDTPEKRASIESQTRAQLITQLWTAGKLTENDTLVVKLRKWLSKLDGGEQNLPEKTSASAIPGQFDNAGQFLTACQKDLGLNKSQVLKGLGANSMDDVNFHDAYIFLKEGKAGTQPPQAK